MPFPLTSLALPARLLPLALACGMAALSSCSKCTLAMDCDPEGSYTPQDHGSLTANCTESGFARYLSGEVASEGRTLATYSLVQTGIERTAVVAGEVCYPGSPSSLRISFTNKSDSVLSFDYTVGSRPTNGTLTYWARNSIRNLKPGDSTSVPDIPFDEHPIEPSWGFWITPYNVERQ